MARALLSPYSTLTSSSSSSTHCFHKLRSCPPPPRLCPLHLQIIPATGTCSSSKRLQLLISQAMQSNNNSSSSSSSNSNPPDSNTAVPKSEETDAGLLPSLVSGLALPNIPVWGKWVLGTMLLLALPFYRRILRVGDAAEKAAEATAEVVEKVAEVSAKIATDVADALPDGSAIKGKVLEIKRVAEEIDKDAEQADAFIHKIDQITDEIEDFVEKGEEKMKEREEKKNKPTVDEDTDENPSTDKPTPK